MMYLAEKTGRFYPQDPLSKYDVAQWVGWQLANQGPKLGEQGHFRRAAESGNNGDLTYALRRFDNERHHICRAGPAGRTVRSSRRDTS